MASVARIVGCVVLADAAITACGPTSSSDESNPEPGAQIALDASADSATEDDCTRQCILVLSVGCPNDTESDCIAECEDLADRAGNDCTLQLQRAMACLNSLDATSFACSGSGHAYVVEDCAAATDALVSCLYFDCQNGVESVPRANRCDGVMQCSDGSDEEECA